MPYRNGRYYNKAWSYEEAKRMLKLYKDAITALVDGQAAEYTIGGRSVRFIPREELERGLNQFADIVNRYEADTIPPKSKMIVFRDV